MSDGSRDRSHLTLNLKDLKPREPTRDSGLSPISLPLSLLDSTLLLSPEKILLAAQQQHQLHQQQQQQHQIQHQLHQQKLETPTPSNFFPKNVTRDQESFAEGFVEALQKLQGNNNISTSSIPTFQNNSPSTVKFLLSLAALTPTLSPSNANKPLLIPPPALQQSTQNANLSTSTDSRLLDVPKIVLSCNSDSTVASAPISSSTLQPGSSSHISGTETGAAATSDIAKSYMDYQLAQLEQSSSAITARHSGTDFFHQQQQTQIATYNPSSSTMGIAQLPQQSKPTTCNFIKQEPMQQPLNNNGIEHAQLNGLHSSASSIPQPISAQPMLAQLSDSSEHGSSSVGRNSNTKGVDMGDQDMRKLERKRARNRLAASKCRQRKLQKIADLEQQVLEEKKRGDDLQVELYRLQTVIRDLEEQLKAGQTHNNR